MIRYIVLLGDSILDNHFYVPVGAAVEDQLRAELGADGKVTLWRARI